MSSRFDEILRVSTSTDIVLPHNQAAHILDVYAIPPAGLEGPPYPLTNDTRGLIEIQIDHKQVFRANLRALMDAYWRFAMAMTISAEDVPQVIASIRAELGLLEYDHGSSAAQAVAKIIKSRRVPGQDIALKAMRGSLIRILRLEETGCMNDSLSPAEVQLYLVRTGD